MTNEEVEQEIIKVIECSIKPLALIDLIILLRDILEHDMIRFYHILTKLVNKHVIKKEYQNAETYYVIKN